MECGEVEEKVPDDEEPEKDDPDEEFDDASILFLMAD